jgi:CxxC motif-containing protein (DUF1111 family)
MAKRFWLLATLIIAVSGWQLSNYFDQKIAPAFDQSELLPGGEMTVKRLAYRSYVAVGRNVDRAKELNFWTGFSFFRDPWVIAPASTTDRDGLGPLFITRSCVTCHHDGGRGPMSPEGLHQPSSLLIRLGSTLEKVNAIDPQYGGQIQPRSVNLLHTSIKNQPTPEAWLDLQYEDIHGTFADGQPYQLQKPTYILKKLSHGPLAKNIGLSPRYAPSIYGMGLLDAISERDLLAQEDIEDRDVNGISPRYNRVLDVVSKQVDAIGRFGFKAKHPNLNQQVADAFVNDIGITNPLFPNENCTSIQVGCQKVSKLGQPAGLEIPHKLLTLVNDFSAYIGVQPARNLERPTTQVGRTLFYQANCHQCHTPSYVTNANYPLKELAGQKIWPYTNLALHDMGAGLSDGIIEFKANGQEWRTPPLWGIGLQKKLSSTARFLHDGRARSISEAILWHGGEAESAKQQYIQMSKADREALLTFVKSI